jgi:hypothetical protein
MAFRIFGSITFCECSVHSLDIVLEVEMRLGCFYEEIERVGSTLLYADIYAKTQRLPAIVTTNKCCIY